MDLRKMQQFIAVAEERHFGRAAARLNMAQPPLSQAIRRLEIELGVDLLDRSRRAVELSAAGKIFLTEARKTIAQSELACRLAQRAGTQPRELQIGMIGAALYRVLPQLVVAFRQLHPDIKVQLHERISTEQIEGILNGTLDLGFVTAQADPVPGLDEMIVERTTILAAVPADSPLANLPSVSVAQLAEQDFILPPKEYRRHFSQTIEMFEAYGKMPRVVQEALRASTVLSLVGAGLGCSVVSNSAATVAPASVRCLPIHDAPPRRPWEMGLMWRVIHPGAPAEKFIVIARNYIAAHPDLVTPSSLQV